MVEKRLHEEPAKAPTASRLGHSDLVDPQFGRLVRMHVMKGRGHPHDHSVEDGHGKVVTRIVEELAHQPAVELVVENPLRHTVENRCVLRSEDANDAQSGQSLKIRSVSSAWPVSSATMSSSLTMSPLSPNASASSARWV